MRQDKFSLLVASSHQSQAPIQSRGCQASNLIKPITHGMLSMDWPIRLKRPVFMKVVDSSRPNAKRVYKAYW